MQNTILKIDGSSFVKIPPVWNGSAPLEVNEQQTDFILDKKDFTEGIDIEHLVPALVVVGGKRDTLTTCVLQTAIDNIQTLANKGFLPEHNYEHFTHVPVSEEEEEIEVSISDEAAKVIDRLVDNAQNVILDTIGQEPFTQADAVNVTMDKTRVLLHFRR